MIMISLIRFWELGWKINTMIHPTIYTMNDWKTKSSLIFKANIESEGTAVCQVKMKPQRVSPFLLC